MILLCLEVFLFPNFQLLDYLTVIILFVVIALQFFWILPYTFIHPVEVKKTKDHNTKKQISILTSNVYKDNRNVSKLLERISFKNPDVVVLLEGDNWWDEALSALDKYYPHSVKHPTEDTYGIHLFSKFELENTEIKFLVEENVPSIHTQVKLRNGKWMKLYALHPSPPSPTQKDTSRQRDAELILVAKLAKKETLPTIVTGDLNDSAWSYTTRLFRKISGLLDPRIGRGRFSTFHAKIPFMQWPLDHIFHSNEFSLVKIKKLKKVGSDHYPLYVKLQLSRSEKAKNGNELTAGSKELRIGEKLIVEGIKQAKKEEC